MEPQIRNKTRTLPKEAEPYKWKPGQSGNPGGRPKKHLLSGCYEAVVEQVLPEDLRIGLRLEKGATYGEAIALGQARAAIKGKTDAAREIGDRLEGKARQAVEVSGPEGGPIDVQYMTDGELDARITELLAIWQKNTNE